MSEKPQVDYWVNSKTEHYVSYDGKIVYIPFNKLFRRDFGETSYEQLNRFIITKKSYVSRLDTITHYFNYFLEFYDTDLELLMGYARLKFLVDNKKKKISKPVFIRLMYDTLFTEEIKAKILECVEDNYIRHIKKDPKKKYAEHLEFTDEHIKLLLAISYSMKIMTPIMFHYINREGMDVHALFEFYEDLFTMYSEDIDIYRKLRETVANGVRSNATRNKLSWQQRAVRGVDIITKADELLKKDIISQAMVRYRFNDNLISLNMVIIRDQLMYFLKEKYKHMPVEISTEKNTDGLSGIDKLEMNSFKVDESLLILTDINTKKTIKRLKKQMKIKLPKSERYFYEDNHVIHQFQVQLVHYFYARYFGGYRDLTMLKRSQYIQLLVLLKRRLQAQGLVYLPQIISGNITKLNKRQRKNTRFVTKIEESSVYNQLVQDKYSTLDELDKSGKVMSLLSTILNSEFTYVDYDNPDKLGEVIEITNEDMMCDEFLRFLNQI